jgi:hypothetical protein
MTCETILQRLVDADPDELAGHRDTAVSRHLATCAKCSAVGAQFLRGTEMLSHSAARRAAREFSLARARNPLTRRVVFGTGVTSFAATVLLAVIIHYSLTTPLPTPRLRRDATLLRTPGELASTRPGMVAGRFAGPLPIEPPVGDRVPAVRYASAERVSAVSLTSSVADAALVDATPIVEVDPPGNQRTIVMRGRHHAVTVVWFY